MKYATYKWDVVATSTKTGKSSSVNYYGFKTKREAEQAAARANLIEGIKATVVKR